MRAEPGEVLVPPTLQPSPERVCAENVLRVVAPRKLTPSIDELTGRRGMGFDCRNC
jgi:hypothetical protein